MNTEENIDEIIEEDQMIPEHDFHNLLNELQSLDSCSSCLHDLHERLANETDLVAVKSVMMILRNLIGIEKFNEEILYHPVTAEIYLTVYSVPLEFFEDVEYLETVLNFSNFLFELFEDLSPKFNEVCPECQDSHTELPSLLFQLFDSTFFQHGIRLVNFFLKECLNGLILSLTWRLCYNFTMSIMKLCCPTLKRSACKLWCFGWNVEGAILECGIPTPFQDLSCLGHDRGGHSYSLLHETLLDGVLGIDWMASAIAVFMDLNRRNEMSLTSSQDDLILKISTSLLNWIARDSYPHHCGSLKRSYATLGLPYEVKLIIYHGIISSNLFLNYLTPDHPTHDGLDYFFRRHLGSLAQDTVETCHESLLMLNFLETDPSSTQALQLSELTPVVYMTKYILETMIFHINLYSFTSSHQEITDIIHSWFDPSWRWIFQDIHNFGATHHPEHYERCGYSTLLTTISDLVDKVSEIILSRN